MILILLGGALIAFAFGFVSLGEEIPVFVKILSGLFGALVFYGGLHQVRFVFRRRSALSGGRERKGTLQLRGKLDDDSSTAHLTFETAYGQWLLMLDPDQIKDRADELREGIRARATVGEDERVYELQIGSEKITLQSEGIAFEGKMREVFEKHEKRLAAQEASSRSDQKV